MGWLIISLILTIVFVIVAVIADKKWSGSCWDMLGSVGAMISLMAVAILSICLVTVKTDEEAFREDYGSTVEVIQNVIAPSDAVTEKILDINEHILRHRVKSSHFMTKGLYSKETGEMPLLEIPEMWYIDPE